MKIEFNTLYWSNTPEEQIKAHQSVVEHFDIPINYYQENTPHGVWMNRVVYNSNSDLIVFFDSDCVPINKEEVFKCIRFVKKTKTFLGVAQASNHIPPKSHVYAAPAFYIIAKECWNKLGQPSFVETHRSDVGEEISYIAENKGIRYRCLYPSSFEREPVEGVWPLGNYGYYGVGTTFENTVYHLYQGRMGTNLELFLDRCKEIVNGTFTNLNHIPSTTMNYNGRVVS